MAASAEWALAKLVELGLAAGSNHVKKSCQRKKGRRADGDDT
jgi:hypothetical protein